MRAVDGIPPSDKYPNEWLLTADIAYIGADKYLRAVVMKKRPTIQRSNERDYYKPLSADRVVCENFYGRLILLWKVMKHTFENDREI